jgi:hypothetical protein
VGTEVLGAHLPNTAANWVLLFIGIVTALTTMVLVSEQFVEFAGGDASNLRRYGGGLVLPVAWVFWSALLLIADREPVPVLVVLLGTLTLAISGRLLIRKFRP